ncbi:MAG: N-acetylneuraminate synthase [Chloroflexota bacterium]|nr:N-acetylneuraminate synthase [Chloroflexota bacterium]
METIIRIEDKNIGPDFPCFIIAEAGINHNGDVQIAKQLIDAALDAGVDAVKFQTFKAEQVVSATAPKAEYQLKTTNEDETQLEMLQRLELSANEHRELQTYCQERGGLFLSTPFDDESVDFLAELEVPAFKIGSAEITNWPLLRHIARKHKPIILSTGMSYLSEVDEAARVIKSAGNQQLILLHCVSNYPASASDVNLRAMQAMATAFDLPVGYSDHTMGIEVSLAAVALGACVLEKHFTLNRNLPGPDQQASLNPGELKALVSGIRTVESALGHGRKQPAPGEFDVLKFARRSLVAAIDSPASTKLTTEHIAIKRPGTGLPPSMKSFILSRTLHKDVSTGTVLTMDIFR